MQKWEYMYAGVETIMDSYQLELRNIDLAKYNISKKEYDAQPLMSARKLSASWWRVITEEKTTYEYLDWDDSNAPLTQIEQYELKRFNLLGSEGWEKVGGQMFKRPIED